MKKEGWVAGAILLLFIIIFLVVKESTSFSFSQELLKILRWVLLALLISPWLVFAILAFPRSTRESKFFSSLGYIIVLYYGVLLMLSSISKELIPADLPLLNSNSFALGIAIVALGWSLFLSLRKEPNTILDEVNNRLNKVDKNLVNINKNIEKLNSSFTGIRDVAAKNIVKLGDDLKKLKNSRK